MFEAQETENKNIEQKLARQKHLRENHQRNTADLVVECLVNEGVEVVFGIPGEENIPLLEAIERDLSLIHISEPTRRLRGSRMPSSA